MKNHLLFPERHIYASMRKFYQVMGRHGSPKVVISHHSHHENGYDSQDSIRCKGLSFVLMGCHNESFTVLGRHGSSGAESGRRGVVIGRHALHHQGNK